MENGSVGHPPEAGRAISRMDSPRPRFARCSGQTSGRGWWSGETPDDRFHHLDREVIWLRRGRLTDSDIATRDLESALGGSDHTRRKLTTVERIVARFAGPEEG